MDKNLRGLRMSGSCVHSLVSVACGRMTAFFEAGPHPWDVCAAVCLIQEAGGVVMDMTGGALDLCSRRYLCAANGTIVGDILACVSHPIPFSNT